MDTTLIKKEVPGAVNSKDQDNHTIDSQNSQRGAENNAYIDQILALAAKGWPVFPCGADKRPLIDGGFKSASTDPEQIRAWWATWPCALVGVATGATSDITVIDIDVNDGKRGDINWQKLVEDNGQLPDTMQVESRSGGAHVYFKNVPGSRCNQSKLAPGIDVRSDGGYIIAPPAPGYRYINPGTEIAEAPAWLKALMVPPVAAVPEPVTVVSVPRDGQQGDVRDRASKYLAKLPPAIQGSNGSGALYNAARAMVHDFDLAIEVAVDLLLAEYNQRCIPAWSEAEIRHKCSDALAKPHDKQRGHLLLAKAPTAKVCRGVQAVQGVRGFVCSAGNGDEATAAAEMYLGKTLEDSDTNHGTIILSIIVEMQRRGLAVDALGNLRDAVSWSRVSCDPVALSEDLSFSLRRDGMKVDAARVGETFRTLARVDATKRRQALTSTFLGKPSSEAGLVEVRRWIRAVTGENREADVAALLQWIWLVKSRVAGRHGELHLMLVIFGLLQGSGKSQAVLRLCAPWSELFDPEIGIDTITDERNAPHLAACAIGLWDELGGLAKADMEKLKHRMTATAVAYRPMRTTSRVELPALMSFIGSSNRSIGELVKDSTGMRRFYEIRASDSINWDEINGIDYNLLWQAVSENDEAPGKIHRQIIAAEQLRLVWRDPVQRWIEDETDVGWQSTCGMDGVLISEVNPIVGASTASLYNRLRAWCDSAGEREPTREVMGRRLSEVGWEAFRLPRSQGQAPGYRQSVHPVQGVQGVRGFVCSAGNGGAP